MEKKEIKVRYKPEDYNKLVERAKESGKTVNEYQKEISKKAHVKIEVHDEI